MVSLKLCDLINCLKPGTKIEFDISCYEKKMQFEGSLSSFINSIHYNAFQTENVSVFYITGNFIVGYTAHIRCLLEID